MKAVYDKSFQVPEVEQDLVSLQSPAHLAEAVEDTPSFYDLGDERGSGVQGMPSVIFRIHKPIRMPIQTHPSFWASLAYGFQGDVKFWGSIKVSTLNYWNSVMSNPEHPRFAGYEIMQNYGVSMGDTVMQEQLQNEHDVTPELWQVVADTFDIELLTIINTPYSPPTSIKHYSSNKPSSSKPARQTLIVVPRGAHNKRQIFILFNPATRDYEAVFPVRNNYHDWRYEKHMPADRVLAPKGDAVEKAKKEKSDSDTKRCPFLKRDEKGVFLEPVSKMEGYEGEIEAPGALIG